MPSSYYKPCKELDRLGVLYEYRQFRKMAFRNE